MKTSELIKLLKTMPPNAEVAYQDHDSDEWTLSSYPCRIDLKDFDNIPAELKYQNIWDAKGKIVCIHG